MIPEKIHKLSETVWELPVGYAAGMRVPARIYATEELLSAMDPGVFEQIANVATPARHRGPRPLPARRAPGLRVSHRRCSRLRCR